MVKERTQELESAQEELIRHARLAVLGQLTATVSHELRNPLGVIHSSTFYLKSKLSDADDKIRKHLQRIGQQVGLCDTIVGDLLEYPRGRRSEMVEGEINHWLEEVLDQITIPEPVSLVCDMSPGLPRVPFDRDKLQRVVINLVNNAVQAVIERQERFKQEDELYQLQVKVATSVVENGISIEVEDNGAGMDEETADRAFEPLFTTGARGSGLGLAIVKKIVEEHGGSVTLESEPDRGTRATVVIPVQPQSFT
jgi:signal transduction histidine kinase